MRPGIASMLIIGAASIDGGRDLRAVFERQPAVEPEPPIIQRMIAEGGRKRRRQKAAKRPKVRARGKKPTRAPHLSGVLS